jgi:peptidoglycan/xylan/chitin deacetylase (PgdA/CDA1 family)
MSRTACRPRELLRALICAVGCAGGCHCACADEPPAQDIVQVPVRFVLTFDDGPDARTKDNSTLGVLEALSHNSVQNDTKAIFFVETRRKNGAATERGRAVLKREQELGHLLALHDGSSYGHYDHCNLSDAKLQQSLRDGVADLKLISDREVKLMRPPFWDYNERTLTAYAQHDLSMLLTDISANDGKTRGFHASPRRRTHMASEMKRVSERIARGEIPVVDDAMPIVVTFHDLNNYTADHMQEYLHILVDEARASGLTVAAQPFYGSRAALERAALVRAHDAAHRDEMVPMTWNWIRRLLGRTSPQPSHVNAPTEVVIISTTAATTSPF